MTNKLRLIIIMLISLLTTTSLAVGKNMQIKEPFFKVFIETEGVKFKTVINGFIVKNDKTRRSFQVEIPINQFVRSGDNKFELQLFSLSKKGNLVDSPSSHINLEFRLYTSLEDYVVLSQINFSGTNQDAGKAFEGSSLTGQYRIENNKFILDEKGDYKISELNTEILENKRNRTYAYHTVNMPTPFPEWKFIEGDAIPDPQQFKTMETLTNGLIGAPFKVLETIHDAIAKKDIDSIMPLFKERNDEMDKAFYYEPGTYEKRLREAIEEEFEKDMILEDIDINVARPMVSPGFNVVQLGTGPLIRFRNENESVYSKYDIFFRKEGNNWIITR